MSPDNASVDATALRAGEVTEPPSGLAGQGANWAAAAGVVSIAGARTPEELETLLEDVLVIRDRQALVELFEEGAVLVAGDQQPARGGMEIARLVLATWEGDHAYIADPRRVMQARDIALIVGDQVINVVRRGHDGAWRYAIVLLSVDGESERSSQ